MEQQKVRAYQTVEETGKQPSPSWGKTTVFKTLKKSECPEDACVYSKLLC
jgi:hypothetical protein